MSDVEKGRVPDDDVQRPSKQQKQEEGATAAGSATENSNPDAAKKGGRFKIAGHLVMAMRRFQASLNPTYSYGKRTSDAADEHTDGHRVVVQPRAGAAAAAHGRSTSGRSTSGRTASGRPAGAAGQSHGHKASLLFRPLPDPDTKCSS